MIINQSGPRSDYRDDVSRRRSDYDNNARGGLGQNSGQNKNGGLLLLVFILTLLTVLLGVAVLSGNKNISSSYNREPIATGVAYRNDCIIDELDWFDNIGNTSKRLQNFYDKTGVQPFIYLKAYDSSLISDSDKDAYANAWYDENIDNESTFLYMYFAELDQDADVGYMVYVNGKQVSSVMDAEAVNIFWDKLDNAWYKDMSTDDMFVSVFDSTAKTIMTKSTTSLDVMKSMLKVVAVLAFFFGIVLILRIRRQHESERNAETERILNADLRPTGSGRDSGQDSGQDSGSGDDLLDRWT